LLTDLSETVSGWFTTVQENHQAITFNTHFKRSSSLQNHKKKACVLWQALKEFESFIVVVMVPGASR